jgi:hypothetical protein
MCLLLPSLSTPGTLKSQVSGHLVLGSLGTSTLVRAVQPSARTILQENRFNLKLFGNEVYFTNALVVLIEIMLCSKLHCQTVLNLNFFPV